LGSTPETIFRKLYKLPNPEKIEEGFEAILSPFYLFKSRPSSLENA
jgi:hypothetical protein